MTDGPSRAGGAEAERGQRQPGSRAGLSVRVHLRLRAPAETAGADMPRRLPGGGGGTLSGAIAKRLALTGAFGRGSGRATQAGRTRQAGAGSSTGGSAAFFVGARQRVTVKAFVGRHGGPGGARAAGQAVARHLRYLAREASHEHGATQDHGAGLEVGDEHPGAEPVDARFYGPEGQLERDAVHASCGRWEHDRHHFRLIISPEHGDRIEDLEGYVRSVMKDLAADLREPGLDWVAINHHDTGHPHAHVLIRGRRASGQNLVIPRRVISHGIRQRAEYRAQELLGDQSRSEAERGLFTRTRANHWTDIDARLAGLAERNGGRLPKAEVDRRDVFGAVTRERLAHLQRLGLVEEWGAEGVRFADGLKERLVGLQAAQDQIRAHWAARRQEAFQSLMRPQEKEVQAERPIRPKSRQRPIASPRQRQPIAASKQQPEVQQETKAPKAPVLDVTVDRMTSLDAELMRRGQLSADTPLATRYSPEVEALLEARARHLIERGDGIRQGHGVGFRPEAWTRLRDREVVEAIRDQLGLKLEGRLSYGRTEGVVAGTISTALGRHVVIGRGVGFAVAQLPAGQELAVGQVIGRSLGIER